MKQFVFGALMGLVFGLIVAGGYIYSTSHQILLTPGSLIIVTKPKPLNAYSYENLKKREYNASEIKFEKLLPTNGPQEIWQISFSSDGKRASGLVNLPSDISSTSAFTKPTIILEHGFGSQDEYYPGFGTERVAAFLAKNGFVTIAPDGLGYGTSDMPSKDVFEERFQSYTTLLNLITAVSKDCKLKSESCKLGLWGHSNGGQITLSALEISGLQIPTVLWNPVSKPFPYSILYFTDDFDDHGKELRKVLANFEVDYDVEKYSPSNYLDWINAPILLQQGGADQSVPTKWSDLLAEELKKKTKRVDYKVYPGADHNMQPSWNQVASDSLNFYLQKLK